MPDGVFAGLSQLSWLNLGGNELSSLPDGVFAGLSQLSRLELRWNPGTPFPLDVGLTRIDVADPVTPGPATVVATVEAGAPFPMAIRLRAEGGLLSDSVVEVLPGGTASGGVTVTPDGSGSHRFVELAVTPSLPDSAYYGLDVRTAVPLVLADPPEVKLDLPVVYLVQATQNRRGTVRLVAGRQALLRAFGTSDLPISHRPRPVATFYWWGEEVHEVRMSPLEVLPTKVEEARLDRSYNATVPGSVIQRGLEIVVELDPEGVVPQASESVSRFPATGRHRVLVSQLPALEQTIVPVHFASDSNRAHNSKVTEFARDLANHDETGFMWHVRNMLPIGELLTRVREPYLTQSDYADNGAYDLLNEVGVLRYLEADGTDEYYHAIWARPSVVSSQDNWDMGGIAYLPGYAAITNVFTSDGWGPYGSQTFAHELGHNLSLPHAPCGNASGVDPAFPYSDGSIGAFGYSSQRNPELGQTLGPIGVVSPAFYKEVMSYCGPKWISDYNFKKAMLHRLDLAQAARGGVASTLGRERNRSVLLLWGTVRDGSLRVEPAFALEAPTKLPAQSGPYRLTGVAESGAGLFQLDFSPDPIDHGGASFLFAVPFEEEWIETLDRIELSGPEGTTSVDRDAGGQAAMLVDESTGRVRSIVRDWPDSDPGAAQRGAGGIVVWRGLPRR